MSTSPHPSVALAPSGLRSNLFTVRQTLHAGRSIYATQRIPAGTHLHTSPSPATFVIYREYRREVCWECFQYDRGTHWKLRDPATGAVWCSAACERSWRARYSPAAIEAMAAVEKFVSRAKGFNSGELDVAMLDVAGVKPLQDQIEAAWSSIADEPASLIRRYRSKEEEAPKDCVTPTKAERKAATAVLAMPPAPDILSYLLSAVLIAHGCSHTWSDFLNLHAASMPYASPSALNQHTSAYHQLLALLPLPLLSHVTADILLAASTRDAQNSFGLRSLDDEGSEMFGFGVWPSASYWNHTCAPNVSKKRVGRSWQFETSRDIEEGEELSITYLGGEEKELNLGERRKRLKETWGFECACKRCGDEQARDTRRF